MSSLMPPQRMTCSPNQSVSTSSLNVVLMTPERDDVGVARRVGGLADGEAVLLRLGPRLRPGLEADDDLVARVAQVLRVRVALRPVADDRDGLAAERLGVDVLVVEDSCHRGPPTGSLLLVDYGCDFQDS